MHIILRLMKDIPSSPFFSTEVYSLKIDDTAYFCSFSLCGTRWYIFFFETEKGSDSEITSDSARHFSNWCDIYKVAKVVHGNQSDNR